jgi:hypothetical protein
LVHSESEEEELVGVEINEEDSLEDEASFDEEPKPETLVKSEKLQEDNDKDVVKRTNKWNDLFFECEFGVDIERLPGFLSTP